jgi:hypothetical protein
MRLGAYEDTTLLIEEADRLPSPDASDVYADMIRRGRHAGVNMILVAPRPVDFHIDVRSQATDIYSFFYIEPNDLKWLRGANGDLERVVRTLPAKYKYARYIKATGQVITAASKKRGGEFEK